MSHDDSLRFKICFGQLFGTTDRMNIIWFFFYVSVVKIAGFVVTTTLDLYLLMI